MMQNANKTLQSHPWTSFVSEPTNDINRPGEYEVHKNALLRMEYDNQAKIVKDGYKKNIDWIKTLQPFTPDQQKTYLTNVDIFREIDAVDYEAIQMLRHRQKELKQSLETPMSKMREMLIVELINSELEDEDDIVDFEADDYEEDDDDLFV